MTDVPGILGIVRRFASLAVVGLLLSVPVAGQQAALPAPIDTLPDGPQQFVSGGKAYRVVPTKGLTRPFSLAFLPNGDMLITERGGRLRIVRGGVLDPREISGMPPCPTNP